MRFPAFEAERERESGLGSALRQQHHDVTLLTSTAGWSEMVHQETKEIVELQEGKGELGTFSPNSNSYGLFQIITLLPDHLGTMNVCIHGHSFDSD